MLLANRLPCKDLELLLKSRATFVDLDECLESLAQNKEVPGDLLLVHFTRLQLIKNKISQIPGLQRACQTTDAPKTS